jgi:hypothetical protein
MHSEHTAFMLNEYDPKGADDLLTISTVKLISECSFIRIVTVLVLLLIIHLISATTKPEHFSSISTAFGLLF